MKLAGNRSSQHCHVAARGGPRGGRAAAAEATGSASAQPEDAPPSPTLSSPTPGTPAGSDLKG
eukprot:4622756-Alexandrium_andersonii.AAC.1